MLVADLATPRLAAAWQLPASEAYRDSVAQVVETDLAPFGEYDGFTEAQWTDTVTDARIGRTVPFEGLEQFLDFGPTDSPTQIATDPTI